VQLVIGVEHSCYGMCKKYFSYVKVRSLNIPAAQVDSHN
jgi:hypothetical protein